MDAKFKTNNDLNSYIYHVNRLDDIEIIDYRYVKNDPRYAR